jgi:hypothetical protein
MHFNSIILILLSLLSFACEPIEVPGGSQCSLATFSATPSTGSELGIGLSSFGGPSIAQSFVIKQDGKISSATVRLQRTGTFTQYNHTLTATIELPGTIGPNGTPLATSETLDPASISTTPSYYKFVFPTPTSLITTQTYWLRIKGSYPVSDSNYISGLAYDGKTGGYTSGSTTLNAVYEQNVKDVFSSNLIGDYRFLLFNIGC